MIDLTDEVRRSLREIADSGQPILLGDKAIHAVRRRRRTQRISVLAAALAVLAVMVPLWLRPQNSQAPVGPPASFSPDPVAPVRPSTHTIAAYAVADGSWQLLNPSSGAYFAAPPGTNAVAVSADLRTAAVLADGRVGIISTADESEPRWAPLPSAMEYTSLSMTSDGASIVIPLWSEKIGGRLVFEDYAIVRSRDLQLTVTEFPSSPATMPTWIVWQDDRLLATLAALDQVGTPQTRYAVVDASSGRLVAYLDGVPTRDNEPTYPWEHRLVNGNRVVVQAAHEGRQLFLMFNLVGSSSMFGPMDLNGAGNARAIGWDLRTDTVLVQNLVGTTLRLVAMRPRTNQQGVLDIAIPEGAVNLILGNGEALEPAAAARKWTIP